MGSNSKYKHASAQDTFRACFDIWSFERNIIITIITLMVPLVFGYRKNKNHHVVLRAREERRTLLFLLFRIRSACWMCFIPVLFHLALHLIIATHTPVSILRSECYCFHCPSAVGALRSRRALTICRFVPGAIIKAILNVIARLNALKSSINAISKLAGIATLCLHAHHSFVFITLLFAKLN